MTFFEKELHRLFDDSECISEDAVFAGKTMIAPIGEDLRAKVQFVYTNTHAKYSSCTQTLLRKITRKANTNTFMPTVETVVDRLRLVVRFLVSSFRMARKHSLSVAISSVSLIPNRFPIG